jgi:phospholipid transport system substrate-binding protein
MIAEMTRRVALAAAIAAGALLSLTAPARADAAAENFVRDILAEANPVFEATTQEERFDGVAALVDKYVDMRRVGLFVLGQYARQISEEQKAQYFPLFKQYATLVYQDALENYSGERLEVTGSVDRSEKDIIVNCRIVGAKPGDDYADLTVHWRVYRDADGRMTVFDAGADQVWLAIEQQSQFKSVIANNGGGTKGIDALIADLRSRVGQ